MSGKNPERLEGALVRPVTIRIPHDKSDGLLAPGVRLEEDELIARTGPTEGEFLLDDSGRRAAIRVNGAPVTYEVSMPLMPGWRPDDWWDVNINDPAALETALGRIGTDAWNQRYLRDQPSNYDVVGRYWVLAEDGHFPAAEYGRTSGPYSNPDWWLPFEWKTCIPELKERGDKGWSARRRRFLPPLACYAEGRAATADVLVEVSFNGANGPWHRGTGLVFVHAERCAITFTERDLTRLSADDGDFVRAYIQGKLRVWVTARVEGDDACFAIARAPGDPHNAWPLEWITALDRAAAFRHERRNLVIGNDQWNDFWACGFTEPEERDDRIEAANVAQRVLDEAGIRRCPGSLQLPFLLRPSDNAPWDQYKVGDEVYEIDTDDYRTHMDLTAGPEDALRAPRVAGVTYRWAKEPAEATTALTVEDKTYDQDNIVGGRG
jgi:hypothetical protein